MIDQRRVAGEHRGERVHKYETIAAATEHLVIAVRSAQGRTTRRVHSPICHLLSDAVAIRAELQRRGRHHTIDHATARTPYIARLLFRSTRGRGGGTEKAHTRCTLFCLSSSPYRRLCASCFRKPAVVVITHFSRSSSFAFVSRARKSICLAGSWAPVLIFSSSSLVRVI